jgi:hypothetical protein
MGEAMNRKWNDVYAERLSKATNETVVECLDSDDCEPDPEVIAELLHRLQEGERAVKALKIAAERLVVLTRCPEGVNECPQPWKVECPDCYVISLLKLAENGEEKG